MDEEGKTGFSSYADALWWGVVRQLNLNEMETHCLEEASPSLIFCMRTTVVFFCNAYITSSLNAN